MESKAYKSKLAPLVGPTTLLKSVGFTHRPEEGKLYYERYSYYYDYFDYLFFIKFKYSI